MDWTAERIAKLAELWQAGMSASQVAHQLGGGLSRNAVIGKIHRMGLKARAIPSRPRAVAGPSSERARRPVRAANVARSVKRTERVFTEHLPAPELTPTACIHTLGTSACRWPIGDPRESDFGYCGRTDTSQGPYCQHHTQLAFRPVLAARAQNDRRPRLAQGGSRSPIHADWR